MKKIYNKINRKFKRLVNRVKGIITYPYYQKLYVKSTLKKVTTQEGKYAIINLDEQLRSDDFSRYFYNICMYVEKAGFQVIVKTGLRDFRGISKNGFQKFIWKEKYIFVRETETPINTIVLVQPNVADHVIEFTYGYYTAHPGQFDCIASYPMHPHQYNYYSDQSIQIESGKSDRTIKILFSGKTRKDMYADVRVKKYFNVLSRIEVVQFILSRFAHSTRSLKTEADKLILEQLLDSETYSNEIIISEIKSEQKDWLKILSKSHFFICPPGARMPWCHNSVEAMSAGAIPILEYADLFHPALEHMKNCLSYKNYDGLEAAIKTALAMDASEIEVLRENVLEYYNKYLSIDSITEKIKQFCDSKKLRLTVYIPFIPTLKEAKTIPDRQLR